MPRPVCCRPLNCHGLVGHHQGIASSLDHAYAASALSSAARGRLPLESRYGEVNRQPRRQNENHRLERDGEHSSRSLTASPANNRQIAQAVLGAGCKWIEDQLGKHMDEIPYSLADAGEANVSLDELSLGQSSLGPCSSCSSSKVSEPPVHFS